MHISPFYSWLFGGIAVVAWVVCICWFYRTSSTRHVAEQRDHAAHEAMAMAWSESRTLDTMTRFPHSAVPVLVYAGFVRARNDLEGALSLYFEAIRRDPSDIRGYLFAGHVLRDTGRFDEADALLRRARRRFRTERVIHEDLAWIAQRRGDWPEAARRWQTVRERFPDSEQGYRQGAQVLRQMGQTTEAEAMLAEANARFPAPVQTAGASPESG